MRRLPKPIVAMVAGYAIGGGHVLHVVCDLTIAADNARFGQTGPKVGSFDGGFGATVLSRLVGPKKAKEIWFLCRQYSAQEAVEMGLVNTVVPLAQLEAETVKWCKEMLALSPMALRLLKSAFNADVDGQTGLHGQPLSARFRVLVCSVADMFGVVPQVKGRLTAGMLVTQDAQGAGRQCEQPAFRCRQSQPARREHPQHVAMTEQRHVAARGLRARDQLVGSRGHLFAGFPVG
jgi:hypothetical protein